MKKILLWVLVGFFIIGLATYLLGEAGFVTSALGVLGFGSYNRFGEKMLDIKAREGKVKADLKLIEGEKEKLKKDGVKDLTPKEEEEYWRDQ